MVYLCCDQTRREAVRAAADLNDIDFLEVVDRDAELDGLRQRILRVHFLKAPAPQNIGPANVAISGGDRVRAIKPIAAGYDGEVLVVTVDRPGDFSSYRLALVGEDGAALAGLDPLLAGVDFSFKVECPSEFDCATPPVCATSPEPAAEIDYLTKDYAGFRQLMLDRLALAMPGWQERSPADLGITLVELLAYVADYLSYRQDAVATEAYLGTARSRISLRRHARLVDYAVHEGCNARAWVQLEVVADGVAIPKGTPLLSRIEGLGARVAPGSKEYAQALALGPEVFETLHDVRLFEAHNAISFHTWGDGRCCLPKGATSAWLKGRFADLAAGDVLLFEEVRGARTGRPEDADPQRRWAVRLTEVRVDGADAAPLADPVNGQPVTEIRWAAADALPFPLCLSARLVSGGSETDLADVSIARGNIALADHGRSVSGEFLGTVPAPRLSYAAVGADRCDPQPPRPVPVRFRPALALRPLTHAAPYDPSLPAAASLAPGTEAALPQLTALSGQASGKPAVTWQVRRDLLNSGADAADCVVETDSDGSARLRFGDGERGLRPVTGTAFTAGYRIGNGRAGNVGVEAIAHVVTSTDGVRAVRNPLPARGGEEPESMEQVRQLAPFAFRSQRRAVTPADYAELASRQEGIQKAAAGMRWTGSWHTMFVTVDRLGGAGVDDGFEAGLRARLEPYRLAGHDLEVESPRYVPLEIEMQVCVKAEYFAADVKAALLRAFSNRNLAEGGRGVFHPDNFSFGQPVYLSPLYAAAQQVAGVASVQVTRFQRQGRPSRVGLDQGRLDLGRLEIARLDNSPDFPERGVFRLQLRGGK